ncbi:MAG: hypothetical protein ACKPA9_14870 [Microcystis sp.]
MTTTSEDVWRILAELATAQYAFGYSSNAVLKQKISYLLDQARLQ